MQESDKTEVTENPSAFDELLRSDSEFHRTVDRYLGRVVATMGLPSAEIKDVLAETWLAATKKSHIFSGESIRQQMIGWLEVVVRAKAVDALRRLQKSRCRQMSTNDEKLLLAEKTHQTEACELWWRFDILLARLQQQDPVNYVLVIERYLEKRTIGELADATGRTVNEVRCRIYRAMERLRTWATEFQS